MSYAYAILGALAGLVMVYLGANVHLGQQAFVDGLPAYVLSALAGSATALGIRQAIQKSFGPLIP